MYISCTYTKMSNFSVGVHGELFKNTSLFCWFFVNEFIYMKTSLLVHRTSPNDITIEMHMHDGMEVGHYMGDNMK